MLARRPVQQRREELVAAALAVAERDGVAAVTVRAVATEAGVSLGVVHYCFDSKTDLMLALAEAIVSEVSVPLRDLPGVDPRRRQSAATLLRHAVNGFWAVIESSRERQLLAFELTTVALRTLELRPVARQQYQLADRAIQVVLTDVASLAPVRWTRPVKELAALTLTGLDGIVLRWLVDADSASARRRLRDLANYVATFATAPALTGASKSAATSASKAAATVAKKSGVATATSAAAAAAAKPSIKAKTGARR